MRVVEGVAAALRGLWFALWDDPGVRLLLLLLLLLCGAVGPRMAPWACLCLGMELMNTAVERLCDAVCRGRWDRTIGAVKDMAAAASMLCQLAALRAVFPAASGQWSSRGTC